MFYQYLDQVMTAGVDLNLTISKTETGLIVMVMPKVNELKDPAQHKLMPLVLKGSPKELDANFFPSITAPVQKTSGLLLNMKAYEAQATQAAAASKAEKDKKDKESKEAKEKKDKYDGFIKKADEFEAAGKPEDAITQLKQARLHATEKQTRAVDEKITAIKAKLGQVGLFDPFAAMSNGAVSVPASSEAVTITQPQTKRTANTAQHAQIQPNVQDFEFFGQPAQQQERELNAPHQHVPSFEIEPQVVWREDDYSEIEDFPVEMRPPTLSKNANMSMNF